MRTSEMAKTVSLLLALLLAGAAPAALHPAVPDVVVRVFTLKHRSPDEALVIVRPALTETGSVILQPRGNTLTVRDTSAAVERAAKTIAAWDVPPRPLDLRVTLLRASTGNPGARPVVPETEGELQGVGDRLRKLFRFTDYARLDTVVVQGVEGQTVAYVLAGDYRLEFQIEPSGDPRQVRLRGLSFERLRRSPGPGVADVRNDILRTTINVPIGQPFILAVGRDEAASGALVLIFNGAWRVPGPGIAGVN
jgi:hypothetical protein